MGMQIFQADSQGLPAYVRIMSPSVNNQPMFWDVQLSIAKSIAALEKPSLARLHHDILEEIGQGPGEKLIEYFLEITKIPEEERDEYFRYVGISKTRDDETVTVPEKADSNRPAQLADTIACGDAPTVLNFRQAHIKEYGEPPSTELIEYFLQKIPEPPRVKADSGETQSKPLFAEKFAATPNATVLKFRERFVGQFGENPSTELTEHFLKKLQENPADASKTAPVDPDSRINFAKYAASHDITTILQFRKEYEKVYNEAPTSELIDIFITNLPKL